jgi:hypothetical protein
VNAAIKATRSFRVFIIKLRVVRWRRMIEDFRGQLKRIMR